jgi:IclR family acetate operon transcriptional repressor
MLVASLDIDRRRKVLKRLVLEPKTPHTITDISALERELEEIRARGYAIDNEENTVGVRCVAAPIRGAKGLVLAAVSITALTSVIHNGTIDSYISEVVRTLSVVGLRLRAKNPAMLLTHIE